MPEGEVLETFSSVLLLSCLYLISSESESRSVMSDSLQPHGLYSPWNSPGQNTGVGSLFLLLLPTQGLNPGLPHCRQILYQMNHQGSARILEWVAMPASKGSSQTRDQTQASALHVNSLPSKPPRKRWIRTTNSQNTKMQ